MAPSRGDLFGYASRLSVQPGEVLSFHVSCEGVSSYDAALVRLRHGYTGVEGPGFLEAAVPSSVDGTYAGRFYRCQIGSCVEVSDPLGLLRNPDSVAIRADVYLTSPRRARPLSAVETTWGHSQRQAILGTWSEDRVAGYALFIEDSRPSFVWSEHGAQRILRLDHRLETNHWYRLTVQIQRAAGKVELRQSPLNSFANRLSPAGIAATAEGQAAATALEWTPASTPFRIGALAHQDAERWLVAAPFNGKIGSVTVTKLEANGREASDTVATWHFGKSMRRDGLLLEEVIDESVNALHGRCVNGPTRAVTGSAFSGEADDFRLAPDEYDAIHFHDDDIVDAEWPAAFTLQVPVTLPSGVYAIRLTAGQIQRYVPFVVTPTEATQRVALLLPTATYLAYGNDHIHFQDAGAELMIGHTPVIHEEDLILLRHPEFGDSCYGVHSDGSGIVLGSARRPLLSMDPRSRSWIMSEGVWGLPADLCIVHWLEVAGHHVDVLTDEDLDSRGYDALAGYRVVITGSHPEYVTKGELDALEQYLEKGGRVMYLGGNGFYATASFRPDQPYFVEVRRSEGGTRPFQTPFGERRHATSGAPAGLWRNKGRPPHRLVGVGFAGQGFDRSTYYERLSDSFDPSVAFIFEDVDADEPIGAFGIMGGGAAGAEVDSYDPTLGSPPSTMLLASSAPFSDSYLVASEDVFSMRPGLGGSEQASVRSDIVFCALPSGGGFLSVGSIAWTAALSYRDYENSVARITSNVLRRFLRDDPLDGPGDHDFPTDDR
jgi:N,N-dimethylformamidase